MNNINDWLNNSASCWREDIFHNLETPKNIPVNVLLLIFKALIKQLVTTYIHIFSLFEHAFSLYI